MRSLLLVISFFLSSAYAVCLREGDQVTLTGVLVSKTYPSPEDVPRPVTRWVLELDKPFECVVDVDKSMQNWDTDVTIFPPNSGIYKKPTQLENKHIKVSGKLMLAITVYNFTAVLLSASDIAPDHEK